MLPNKQEPFVYDMVTFKQFFHCTDEEEMIFNINAQEQKNKEKKSLITKCWHDKDQSNVKSRVRFDAFRVSTSSKCPSDA